MVVGRYDDSEMMEREGWGVGEERWGETTAKGETGMLVGKYDDSVMRERERERWGWGVGEERWGETTAR